GRMGRGIALAYALRGHRVAIVDFKPRSDNDYQALRQSVLDELQLTLEQLASLGMFDSSQIPQHLSRISVHALAEADAVLAAAAIVYEGVPETLDAKRDALGRISAATATQTIIASTTSTMLAS